MTKSHFFYYALITSSAQARGNIEVLLTSIDTVFPNHVHILQQFSKTF